MLSLRRVPLQCTPLAKQRLFSSLLPPPPPPPQPHALLRTWRATAPLHPYGPPCAALLTSRSGGRDRCPPPPPASKYSPSTSGVLSLLPASWVPYGELIRLDKPTGTVYLVLPCLWSTVMGACLTTPVAPASSVLYTSLLFTIGGLIMRGVGCIINDLWDRNIDGKVARTRLRPLARRAVTPRNALLFGGVQGFAGLALLVQFPVEVVYAALPSMLVVAIYPAMKRFTNYPQVVLGTAFSWGALLGFPALGLSLMDPVVGATAACLYASNVAWTILYDTIYAHQDIEDDKKAGVKSAAIASEGRTRVFLSVLGVAQISLLAGAGAISGMGPAFFIGSCGGGALGLAWMIKRANFKRVDDCWWWFKWCAWTVGGLAVGGGLVAEYSVRKVAENAEKEQALLV